MDIDKIIADIQKGSCVLIVGPDLINFGGKSFFELLCEELQNDAQYGQHVDLSPQYVFSHEELLQIKPNTETKLLEFIEKFYARQTQYDEPFNKIAQIPFHLIVSFFPDTRLKNKFEELGLDFQYGYYPSLEGFPLPVDWPTRKTPLIYNILGDFVEKHTIITFNDLFKYLSGIMGGRDLPKAIQAAFMSAASFLFLGVHFERWHVQLILQIITTMGEKKEYNVTKDKPGRFSILKYGGGGDVYTFMARRLEMEFEETEPIDFLDKLYNGCASKNLLKIKRARVFISYSSINYTIAFQVGNFLKSKSFDVIIDEETLIGGQTIDAFIDTINDVDCVLAIISKESLLSPWVVKEIITTLKKTKKYLLPCNIDDSFLDKDFMTKARKHVDEKLLVINQKIMESLSVNIDDLTSERKQWIEYINNLPIILDELNKRKCTSLKSEDFDKNILKTVDFILTNKK